MNSLKAIRQFQQVQAYMQVQRVMCLLLFVRTVAGNGSREKEINRTRMNADEHGKDKDNNPCKSVKIRVPFLTYDLNGNRKTQIEFQDSVSETTTYNYDSVDRLKDFTVTEGANTSVTQYTFEGYNRRTELVTENSTVTKSRTYYYDETDWLISIADSIQQSAISYVYDNNGNTIFKSDDSLPNEDTTFTYDVRNQLVETKRGPPGSEVVLGQYDYNSDGLRVRHRQSERGDVDYYYDENAVIEEHNASDDSLLAHYRYADRLLSLDTGGTTQYYHHDALGSTVNLTDDLGGIQVSYKLDPWGQIRSQTGTSVNRQIFTGQEHDENTGLIYFGARYYDPDTARFLTQDSYFGEQNTPPSLHRYLYAYSNPMVYIDLMGYEAEQWYQKYWKEHVDVAKDFYLEKLHSTTFNNPFTQALAAGAETAVVVVHGITTSPITAGEEIGEFASDPSLEKALIVGAVGTHLGEASSRFVEDPSLESAVELTGAVSSAALTIIAPVQTGRTISARGFKAKGATQAEAAIASESNAVRTTLVKQNTKAQSRVEPKITTEPKAAGQFGKGKKVAGEVEKKVDPNAPKGKVLRGSANPKVAQAAVRGRAVHKRYRLDEVYGKVRRKEFRLPSRQRIDFIDFEKKIIYELKPNNPPVP